MKKQRSRRTFGGLVYAMVALGLASIDVGAANDEQIVDKRTPLVIDFMDGTYLPGPRVILVVGAHGLVGTLSINGDKTELKRLSGVPLVDFTAVEKLSDTEALVGSSKGKLFLYDGSKVTEIAALSEFDEPLLDIAVDAGKAWAVGARGLIARSENGRDNWEAVQITEVQQPVVKLPSEKASDWFFGVSNLNPDSIKFVANIAGAPVVSDQDYTLYPDEGYIQIGKDLDADPAPSITFTFNPGPAFRAGDVSWNVVLVQGERITLAGEFGMVIQSLDGGQTWVRRDTLLTPREPEPPYWLAGTARGDITWLAGAAGVSRFSTDGGVTWTGASSVGNEGIFGVTLLGNGQPVIAGAVGLIGTLSGDAWQLADRTELKLLSWLKTPIEMPDGAFVVLGGRSTTVVYKNNEWKRLAVEVKE